MKRLLSLIALILTLAACRFSQPVSSPETPTAPPVASTAPPTIITTPDVPYVTDGSPSQTLDVYQAEGAEDSALPVMIFVHGGAWAIGDKSRVDFKDDVFVQSGYLFLSINYRLAPEGDWRDMAQDVAAAVAWAREHAADYGGDPQHIYLMGHSAGAHLVSLVGTDETYLQNVGLGLDALSGVISLDTRAYNIPALAQADGSLPKVYAYIFGADPADWESASPLIHVTAEKNIPPFAVAWSMGLAGNNAAAREAVAREFADALQAAGVPVLLLDGSAKTHEEINRQFGVPDDVLTAQALDWLSQHP